LKGVKLKIPKIGIAICNSGASNTGTLTGLAAFDVVKKLGEDIGLIGNKVCWIFELGI